MKRSLIAVTASFAMTTTAFAQSNPPEIPLRDFFRNPESANFLLSPDGEKIAFLKPYENRLNIWVQPEKGGEAKRLTGATDRDIRGFAFKGNDFVVYVKDKGGDENFHLYSVSLADGKDQDLTPFDNTKVQLIDDLEDHPTDVIIGMNKRNPQIFDAYRLNVKTGELQMIAENPGNISDWLTDHDGKLRVATTTDGVNTSVLYRRTENDPWKTVITTDFKASFSPQFFTFDNANLYGVSNIGRDKAAAVEFDLESGKEKGLLFQRDDVDVAGLSYSRKRKVLTAAGYTTWKDERKFFDRETEDLFRALESKLPGYDVSILSSNKEEDRFVVRTLNDRSLGGFYLYDLKSGDLRKLADRAPWLNADYLAEMKPIEYKARDGLTMHGYLTLPQGRPGTGLPVVVNPHGGPWARDQWGFNPEVQFLANRGYAILQINFRSSTGYGRAFWEVGFKQWGLAMQDDITDGVHWLIDQRIADPKRVAIYGGSYGGYATLEGLVKTPDLYAAGVDFVGPSNLFTLLNSLPPYWEQVRKQFYEMIGDPEKDKEYLRAVSPVFHADRIKAPLFVAQGANDPRVKKAESDQIVEALKKRGIAVEYMVKENEGHGFANEENRLEFYAAMEEFLKKHVPPENGGSVHR
jgi:dipeptidyl aminopeptidase/acylaminoacyl peptidase